MLKGLANYRRLCSRGSVETCMLYDLEHLLEQVCGTTWSTSEWMQPFQEPLIVASHAFERNHLSPDLQKGSPVLPLLVKQLAFTVEAFLQSSK
jgi:hypothetical protein